MFRRGFHSLSKVQAQLLGFRSLSSLQHSYASSESSLKHALVAPTRNHPAPLFPLPAMARFSTTAAPGAKQNSDKTETQRTEDSEVDNSATPELEWAQREGKVYLTVTWAEAKDLEVVLSPEGVFTLSGILGADNNRYVFQFVLFSRVDVQASKVNTGGEKIFFIIMKAEKKWWKKLVLGKSPHYVKVDCDKWVEEDADEAPSDVDTGGMDFSKFGVNSGNKGVRCMIGEHSEHAALRGSGLEFDGFGEEEGRGVYVSYTFRNAMRQLGLEEGKDFTRDPNGGIN